MGFRGTCRLRLREGAFQLSQLRMEIAIKAPDSSPERVLSHST